jgi:hypothetical protein
LVAEKEKLKQERKFTKPTKHFFHLGLIAYIILILTNNFTFISHIFSQTKQQRETQNKKEQKKKKRSSLITITWISNTNRNSCCANQNKPNKELSVDLQIQAHSFTRSLDSH